MFERLTPLEFKVARLIASKKSATVIAADMGVTRGSVLMAARRVKRKLGLANYREVASTFVDLHGHDLEEETLP